MFGRRGMGVYWQAGWLLHSSIDSHYRCWACIKYGRRFGKIAKKKRDCTINNFEQLISEFLTHWNQKHKAITATLALRSRARRIPNMKEFL